MQTEEFGQELVGLIELAQDERIALMCAEAVPWRCHRSLIADALIVHGVASCEIVSPTKLRSHKLTPFARTFTRASGAWIDYPPEQPSSRWLSAVAPSVELRGPSALRSLDQAL